MRLGDLSEAIQEAERFLSKANPLFKRNSKGETFNELGFGSPATAAVKRSSMDLTRALANLRKTRESL